MPRQSGWKAGFISRLLRGWHAHRKLILAFAAGVACGVLLTLFGGWIKSGVAGLVTAQDPNPYYFEVR